jgi:hypothetical protein
MQLAEEPLVSRREILRILKLGMPSTEAPFSTLRAGGMASHGWSVPVRKDDGRVAGRLHMYSVLNLDAARAARLRRKDLARRLAARATEVEDSSAGWMIREAVRRASARLPAYLAGAARDDAWSDRLGRYLDLRQGLGWEGFDRDALAREWLVRSEAWLHLGPDEEEQLIAAVRELAASAQAARSEELAGEPLRIDSFTGVVSHLDPEAAEIVSDTREAWVMSRRELDREGLARLGEAVTVIREELPGGGEAWLAAPAVDLAIQTAPTPRTDNEILPFLPAGAGWGILDPNKGQWLSRALRRDPFILPPMPVRVGPEN